MDTMTKVATRSITNTKLAVAALLAFAAGGVAFVVLPTVSKVNMVTKPSLIYPICRNFTVDSCLPSPKGTGVLVGSNKTAKTVQNTGCARDASGAMVFSKTTCTGKTSYQVCSDLCPIKVEVHPACEYILGCSADGYRATIGTSVDIGDFYVQKELNNQTDPTPVGLKSIDLKLSGDMIAQATAPIADNKVVVKVYDNKLLVGTAELSGVDSGTTNVVRINFSNVNFTDRKLLTVVADLTDSDFYSFQNNKSKSAADNTKYLVATVVGYQWDINGKSYSGNVNVSSDKLVFYNKNITCTDSDGGLNYYVQGVVTSSINGNPMFVAADYCLDNKALMEKYCYGNEIADYPINCDTLKKGSTCQYGRCVGPVTSSPPISCTDTDGGQNFAVKGTATRTNQDGTSASWTDVCVGTTAITEGYCVGNYLYAKDSPCPTGTSCSDGACIAK